MTVIPGRGANLESRGSGSMRSLSWAAPCTDPLASPGTAQELGIKPALGIAGERGIKPTGRQSAGDDLDGAADFEASLGEVGKQGQRRKHEQCQQHPARPVFALYGSKVNEV